MYPIYPMYPMTMLSNWQRLLALLLLLLLLGTAIGILYTGPTEWSLVQEGAIARLLGRSTSWNPLLDERLPRLIVLICSGASLTLSGIITQSLFQNPLASPMSLGLTAGSSLCVLPLFLFGHHLSFPMLIPITAFLGALGTLLLVYTLAQEKGHVQLSTLLLTGMALSTVLSAIQGTFFYALREEWSLMQLLTEWAAGSTLDRTWQHVHLQLPLTLVGLLGCWSERHALNLLAAGEEEAFYLGVDVQQVRWRLFLSVSLLVGGAMAGVGMIGFFSLILPHFVRRWMGNAHQLLLPAGFLLGATTLSALDLTLRVIPLHAFSIGTLSSLLGGFFFLFLLTEQRERDVAC